MTIKTVTTSKVFSRFNQSTKFKIAVKNKMVIHFKMVKEFKMAVIVTISKLPKQIDAKGIIDDDF